VDVEYPIPSDDAVPYPVDVVYPVGDAYAYPDMDGAYGGYEDMPAVAPYPDADVYTYEHEESAKGLLWLRARRKRSMMEILRS
jgi:hypothetical protein